MGGTPSILVEAAAGALVGNAISSVASRYEMHEGVDVTLYCLQQEVIKIQCAINIGRQRQITDPKLLEWLSLLVNATYLGNFYHRILKNRNSVPLMIESEGTSNLPLSTFCHANKRRRIIKNLLLGDDELEKLQDVVKMLRGIDMSAFLLMLNTQPERPVKMYLYMDNNRLVHRDKEREQVMNFLLGPNSVGENNVDILSIDGSWGGGKTSLALHCFYDPKVQSHFSLNIYFSNSRYDKLDGSSFSTILKLILNECNVINITNDDENTLIAMLKQTLSSERYLLLLDKIDYVNSNVWKVLCDCLSCGKQGSKVVFIGGFYLDKNRKKSVNPRRMKPVVVNGFLEDEYMLFFMENAFGSADPDDYPELAEIGREIAKELDGMIWAAKIFGELLRDNLNALFWSNLRDGILNSKPEWSDGKALNLFTIFDIIFHLLPKPQFLPKVKRWVLQYK